MGSGIYQKESLDNGPDQEQGCDEHEDKAKNPIQTLFLSFVIISKGPAKEDACQKAAAVAPVIDVGYEKNKK